MGTYVRFLAIILIRHRTEGRLYGLPQPLHKEQTENKKRCEDPEAAGAKEPGMLLFCRVNSFTRWGLPFHYCDCSRTPCDNHDVNPRLRIIPPLSTTNVTITNVASVLFVPVSCDHP